LLASVRKTKTYCYRNFKIVKFLSHFFKKTIFPLAWSLKSNKNTIRKSRKITSHLHGGQNPTKHFDCSLHNFERCNGDVGFEKRTNVGSSKYMYSSTFPIHCQTLSESGWLPDYIPQFKQNTVQDCKLWMPHC
jgi:hypothetical protein